MGMSLITLDCAQFVFIGFPRPTPLSALSPFSGSCPPYTQFLPFPLSTSYRTDRALSSPTHGTGCTSPSPRTAFSTTRAFSLVRACICYFPDAEGSIPSTCVLLNDPYWCHLAVIPRANSRRHLTSMLTSHCSPPAQVRCRP